jgi:hypothetical protein
MGDSHRSDKRLENAIRQAGHIVIAYLKGIHFTPVDVDNINPDSILGAVDVGEQLRDKPPINPERDMSERIELEHEIMFYLGARAALAIEEDIHHIDHQTTSYKNALQLAMHASYDARSANGLVEWLFGRALQLLKQPPNHAMLKAMQMALYNDGPMSPEKAKQLMHDAKSRG